MLSNVEAAMAKDTRSVLVTGASRGLGRALSEELAARGMRVVMVARGEGALRETVDAIRAKGGDVFAVPGDVGAKDEIHRITGAATALVGAIDVLVHNASTLGPVPMTSLLDTTCEDFEQVLQTNLIGPFRMTKVIAGSMVLRGGGLVVHVSSDAAVNGYPNWGAYGVSKAALDHLGRTWAAELTDAKVRFVSIDPGEMDTQMHADAMPDADRASLARPEAVAKRIADVIARDAGFESGARIEAAQWSLSS